jgi:hypothetical protein
MTGPELPSYTPEDPPEDRIRYPVRSKVLIRPRSSPFRRHSFRTSTDLSTNLLPRCRFIGAPLRFGQVLPAPPPSQTITDYVTSCLKAGLCVLLKIARSLSTRAFCARCTTGAGECRAPLWSRVCTLRPIFGSGGPMNTPAIMAMSARYGLLWRATGSGAS